MIALTAALAGGCSSGPAKKNAVETPRESPVPKGVQTGAIEVIQRGAGRELEWTCSADSSEVTYDGNGKLSGTLRNVRGFLYEKGRQASTFEAREAYADQASNVLRLSGGVKVTGVVERATLSAGQVSWLAERKMIEASGDVQVSSQQYEMGKMQKLWAKPDLTDVGTPDMFAAPRKK